MINDAIALAKQGKPHYIEEQGAQYEGLVVWFNSLVDSAGGQIITANNKVVVGPSTQTRGGDHAPPRHVARGRSFAEHRIRRTTRGSASRRAPRRLRSTTRSCGRPPQAAGIQKKMGYALFPTVTPGTAPKVSIGGYNLGVSTYSKYPQQAFEAIKCLTQPKNQVRDAVKGGLAPVAASVYDEPSIAKSYPFHAMLKAQIEHYGIRPKTPAYADVSLAIQKSLSPTSNINPSNVVTTLADEIKKSLTSGALL